MVFEFWHFCSHLIEWPTFCKRQFKHLSLTQTQTLITGEFSPQDSNIKIGSLALQRNIAKLIYVGVSLMLKRSNNWSVY